MQYRKRLGVFSFKIKRPQYYKNPHAIPLQRKEKLKKMSHPVQRISEAERESLRPFGKFSKKKGFTFDIDLVPHYNVPNLEGFKLQPYVPHVTPKIPEEIYVPCVTELPENIKNLKLAPEVFEPAAFDEENTPK